MKFPGYSVLAAAAIFMVVFGQQSDGGGRQTKQLIDTIRIIEKSSKENQDALVFVNATIALRDAFINSIRNWSMSQDIVLNEISATQKLSAQNPGAAKQLLQKAFVDVRVSLFKIAVPIFRSIGIALGLSNDGARKGLGAASQLIQIAGLAALDAWSAAERLFNQEMDARGNVSEVTYKSVRLAFEAGFAGAFNNVQKSIEVASQALRDAKRSPLLRQVENLNCDSSAKYPEISDAIKDINEAANSAMKRGANANLVQNLKQVLICSIDGLVNVTVKAERNVRNIKTISRTEPLTAKIMFTKEIESVAKGIHDAATKLYLILGEVAVKSNNHSNKQIEAAIMAIEKGLIEMFLGIETAGDLLILGISYQGDAHNLAFQAAFTSGLYSKMAFIRKIVEAARLEFSVL